MKKLIYEKIFANIGPVILIGFLGFIFIQVKNIEPVYTRKVKLIETGEVKKCVNITDTTKKTLSVYRAEDWDDCIVSESPNENRYRTNSYGKKIHYYTAEILK